MDKDTYKAMQYRKEQTNLLILSLDTRIRKLEAKVAEYEKERRLYGQKEVQKEKRHDVRK